MPCLTFDIRVRMLHTKKNRPDQCSNFMSSRPVDSVSGPLVMNAD